MNSEISNEKNCPQDDEGNHLVGENVCIEQTIQNSTVNVTYLQSVSVKEYTWCVQVRWADK